MSQPPPFPEPHTEPLRSRSQYCGDWVTEGDTLTHQGHLQDVYSVAQDHYHTPLSPRAYPHATLQGHKEQQQPAPRPGTAPGAIARHSTLNLLSASSLPLSSPRAAGCGAQGDSNTGAPAGKAATAGSRPRTPSGLRGGNHAGAGGTLLLSPRTPSGALSTPAARASPQRRSSSRPRNASGSAAGAASGRPPSAGRQRTNLLQVLKGQNRRQHTHQQQQTQQELAAELLLDQLLGLTDPGVLSAVAPDGGVSSRLQQVLSDGGAPPPPPASPPPPPVNLRDLPMGALDRLQHVLEATPLPPALAAGSPRVPRSHGSTSSHVRSATRAADEGTSTARHCAEDGGHAALPGKAAAVSLKASGGATSSFMGWQELPQGSRYQPSEFAAPAGGSLADPWAGATQHDATMGAPLQEGDSWLPSGPPGGSDLATSGAATAEAEHVPGRLEQPEVRQLAAVVEAQAAEIRELRGLVAAVLGGAAAGVRGLDVPPQAQRQGEVAPGKRTGRTGLAETVAAPTERPDVLESSVVPGVELQAEVTDVQRQLLNLTQLVGAMQQQHQLLASQLHMQRAAVDHQQQHGQRLAAEQQSIAQMAAAAAAVASAAAAAAKSPRAADPLAHGSPGSVASSADAHSHDQVQPHDQQHHHQQQPSTPPAHAVLQQLQHLGVGVRQLQERQKLMQGALRAQQGLLDELQAAVLEQNVVVSEQGRAVTEHREALAEHRQLLTQHHGAVERLLGVVSEQQAAASEQRRVLDGALAAASQVAEGARRDEELRAELGAAVAAVREEAEQHACAARASVDELAKGMEHLAACLLAAVVAAPPAPVAQPLGADTGMGAAPGAVREGPGDEDQGEAGASGSGLGEVRRQVRALQQEMRRMRAAVAVQGGVGMGMGSARGAGGLAAGGGSSFRRRGSASSALNSARASATSLGAVSSGSGMGRQQQEGQGQGQGGGGRAAAGNVPLSRVVRRRQGRQQRALSEEQQGLEDGQGLEVEVLGVAEASEGMMGPNEGGSGTLLRRLQQLSREVEVLRTGEALALEAQDALVDLVSEMRRELDEVRASSAAAAAAAPAAAGGAESARQGREAEVSELMHVVQRVNEMLSSNLAQALHRISVQGEELAHLRQELQQLKERS